MVVEFEGSGLTLEQFARRRGLNVGNFTFWYYKLRAGARANPASQAIQFVPVRVTTSDAREGLDVFEARIRELIVRRNPMKGSRGAREYCHSRGTVWVFWP